MSPARKKKPAGPTPVESTRHADTRVNIPGGELADFVADAEKQPRYRVRVLMDEVLGDANFVAQITFATTTTTTGRQWRRPRSLNGEDHRRCRSEAG